MAHLERMIEIRAVMRGLLAICLLAEVAGAAPGRLSPKVLKRAREIKAGFKGEAGRVAQFGDSITYSMAFWSAMSWSDPGKFLPEDDGLPKAPAGKQWKNVIKGARDKGARFANYSEWEVGNLLKSVDVVITRDSPEVGLIMIGTNDINGKTVPEAYRAGLEKVVAKCIAAHCVPILNTIPPRRDHAKAVAGINRIVCEIATAQNLPLVDYHVACLRMRPDRK